jgi:hypothetical protein
VKFHDMQDADAIRSAASDIVIEDSTFDRLRRGPSGVTHNDFVQITGGGPFVIRRNMFGQREAGAGQIWMDAGIKNRNNPIHDVRVENNLFWGDMLFAIRVSGSGGDGAGKPTNIQIVNNTILSGSVNAVWVGDGFESVPAERRPLVANNIMNASGDRLCRLARVIDNVVQTGDTCRADNYFGSAHLNSSWEPTRDSDLVIGTANPLFAPATDFRGHARVGAPDIGAVEYIGSGAH